jgi:hypothetical protein
VSVRSYAKVCLTGTAAVTPGTALASAAVALVNAPPAAGVSTSGAVVWSRTFCAWAADIVAVHASAAPARPMVTRQTNLPVIECWGVHALPPRFRGGVSFSV